MNSNTAIYLLHKNSNTYTIGMNLLLMHIFDNFLTKSSYESTMIFENAFNYFQLILFSFIFKNNYTNFIIIKNKTLQMILFLKNI